MMKQLLAFLFVLIVVLGFSMQTQAELYNRGTDILGNRLIYDNDLNITWYDYTRKYYDTWQNQVNWASALTVNFGGTIYDDWRLPATVGGLYTYGYDGKTTGGYNITSSEMGHLYYIELGNKGWYDTSGSGSQPGWGLRNTGDFQNLYHEANWSSTEYAGDTNNAWGFQLNVGSQICYNKINDTRSGQDAYGRGLYAIAVRPGDVPQQPIAPEPISSILFVTGGATLIGRHYTKRK